MTHPGGPVPIPLPLPSPPFASHQNYLGPSSLAGMQGACRAMAALDNLASVYMQSGNWVSRAAVGAGAVELALVDTGLVIQRVAAASADSAGPGVLRCCGPFWPFPFCWK